MNQNLKKIIFKKLYQDLSNVEIITHNESIWFIDRENKYWYIIYEKNGFTQKGEIFEEFDTPHVQMYKKI